MSDKIGVMICGHGSRSQVAVDEFSVLADRLPEYLPTDWEVEYGYLEFANPVIRVGLDKLREPMPPSMASRCPMAANSASTPR
jgi:sirohydrochlorin cobaltochelatase